MIWKVAISGYMAHVEAASPGEALDKAIAAVEAKSGRSCAHHVGCSVAYMPAFIRTMRAGSKEKCWMIP